MNDPNVIRALADAFPLVWPEALLVLGACVLFLGGTFRENRHVWGAAALIFLGAALVATALARPPQAGSGEAARTFLYSSPLLLDRLALFIKVVSILGGAVLVLFSWDSVPDRWAAEYHACILVIVAGMALTGSANELVTLFLALEMVSIPTYVLLYLPRYDREAQEAAMKYFLLSVFSSALLLFGFSYLYGAAGTTNVPGLTAALARAAPAAVPGVALVALVMVVAGLGFRITAVPFHFYAPDVYQGTTAAAAGLLAFAPKVAGFVALLRVLGFVPHEAAPDLVLEAQLPTLLWILAAVTMTLGNVLALLQDNVKRLLAYSSVAHAGYMLIGLAAAAAPHQRTGESAVGVDAVLFYLVAYGAMTIGAFAVLARLRTAAGPAETVEDLSGLARSHPGLALVMALFLFSLIGIPLTAGFVGKLLVFQGALGVPDVGEAAAGQARLFRILALIGAINAAVGAWYYLRLTVVMYLRPAARPVEVVRGWPGLAALTACAVVTLLFGVYPEALARVARDAVGRPGPRPEQVARP